MTYSGSKVKLISLTVVGAGFFSSQSCSVTPTEFFFRKMPVGRFTLYISAYRLQGSLLGTSCDLLNSYNL